MAEDKDLELLRLRAKAKLKLQEQQQASQAPEAAPAEEPSQETTLGGIGQAALRTLDAPGSIARSTVSKLVDGLQNIGNRPFLPESLESVGESLKETFIDPIRGTKPAPSAGDIRRQLGVEDKDLSIPLPGNVPGIGESLDLAPTVDTIGGAAADPLTFTGVGPAARALKKGGSAAFKSGLKDVDKEIARKGGGSFSKLAKEEGLSGNNRQLVEQTEALKNKVGGARESLFDQADDLGLKVNVTKVFDEAQEVAEKAARTNPGLSKRLLKKVQELKEQHKAGTMSVRDASKLKSEFQDNLPESAFRQGTNEMKAGAQQLDNAIQRGLSKQIKQTGNSSKIKGLGDEINAQNKKFQTIFGALGRKSPGPLRKAAEKEAAEPLITALEGAALGTAATGNLGGLGAFAGLRGVRAAKGTGFRSGLGKGLEAAGSIPGLDTVLRRGAIEAGSDN